MTLHLASLTLVLAAASCYAQTSIEIQLPPTVPSESFFVRYCITGESDGFCDWIEPKRNVFSYSIDALYAGRPAVKVRALLYAPGCAIETMAFSAAELLNHPQYSFTCRALPAITIDGELTRIDRLHGRKFVLQAKYVPYWAQNFLGIADGTITTIPVGEPAYPGADNSFRLPIPDFAHDPLAAAADHAGSIQIWAMDPADGSSITMLLLTENAPQGLKTRMGGLRIQAEYPPKLTFSPCAVHPGPVLDAFGFAQRPGGDDACNR